MFVDVYIVLSLVSSILTLTLIACDRFFGIVFAMKARVTERRSTLFVRERRSTLLMTQRRSTLLFTHRRSTLFVTERRSTLLMTASLDAVHDIASLDAALHTASLDTVHDRTSLHATHDIASLHLDAARDTASLDAAYRARLDRRRDAVVADPRLPPTVCPSLARPHRDLVRRQLAAGIYRPSLFSVVKRIRSTWGIL